MPPTRASSTTIGKTPHWIAAGTSATFAARRHLTTRYGTGQFPFFLRFKRLRSNRFQTLASNSFKRLACDRSEVCYFWGTLGAYASKSWQISNKHDQERGQQWARESGFEEVFWVGNLSSLIARSEHFVSRA